MHHISIKLLLKEKIANIQSSAAFLRLPPALGVIYRGQDKALPGQRGGGHDGEGTHPAGPPGRTEFGSSTQLASTHVSGMFSTQFWHLAQAEHTQGPSGLSDPPLHVEGLSSWRGTVSWDVRLLGGPSGR